MGGQDRSGGLVAAGDAVVGGKTRPDLSNTHNRSGSRPSEVSAADGEAIKRETCEVRGRDGAALSCGLAARAWSGRDCTQAAPHFRRPNLSPASEGSGQNPRRRGAGVGLRMEGRKKMIGRPEKWPSPKHTHTHTHVDGTRVDKTRESGRRVGEKMMALTGLEQQHKQCWMAATAQAMDVHCWGVPSSGPGVAGYQGCTLEATQLLLHGAHARIGPFDCRSGAVRLSDSERDLLDASSARWSTRCISGINNHGYKHPSISIVSFFPRRAAAAALFPCPFVFVADSSPFLFKSGLAQRQSAQHMSLSSGQVCLASSICPLPESASPCPLPTT